MTWYNIWKPWPIICASMVLTLLVFVACGAAEEAPAEPAAPASEPAAAPAAAPAAQPAAQPAADPASQPAAKAAEPAAPAAAPAAQPEQAPPTPTTVAAAAVAPAAGMVEGPQEAPDFASYWKPPIDFYGEPVYGGTLRINYEDPLEHANIWGALTGAARRVRLPVHDTLMQDNPYNPGSPYIPGLAYGWTVDADLSGVTFYLKDNVQWHNGAPFVCEDARFTYETMITGEGITRPYMQVRLKNVILDELQCLDDHTLKFRYEAPDAVPLLHYGNTATVIFNKEWFLAGGEDAMFQDVSLGTGPFMWQEGQTVGFDQQHFDKNPNYHVEGVPYVDQVTIFGILDETVQQATMLAHQTDWHWVRNFGQYDEYVSHDQIQVVIRATRSSENLWINMRNAPFDNVRIRQAIAMGMDRATGIIVSLSGYGSQGLGLMPPGSAWAVSEADGCSLPGWCEPADMEAQRAEAIQILNEEGFDFDKTYVLTVESDAQRVNRATFMQEQLRLLGIKTDFDTNETVSYREISQNGKWGDFLASTGGVAGIDDPFIGLGHYHRCDSLYNFQTPGAECDATAEGLFEELGQLTAYEDQKAKGQEIQLYLMSQYWNFPAFWEQEAVAFWPEVRGYVHFPGPTSSHLRWAHMWIDPARADDTGFSGQTTGVPGGE